MNVHPEALICIAKLATILFLLYLSGVGCESGSGLHQ